MVRVTPQGQRHRLPLAVAGAEERVRSGSRETSDVLRASGPNSHEFGYEFSRGFAFLLQTRSCAPVAVDFSLDFDQQYRFCYCEMRGTAEVLVDRSLRSKE